MELLICWLIWSVLSVSLFRWVVSSWWITRLWMLADTDYWSERTDQWRLQKDKNGPNCFWDKHQSCSRNPSKRSFIFLRWYLEFMENHQAKFSSFVHYYCYYYYFNFIVFFLFFWAVLLLRRASTTAGWQTADQDSEWLVISSTCRTERNQNVPSSRLWSIYSSMNQNRGVKGTVHPNILSSSWWYKVSEVLQSTEQFWITTWSGLYLI